MLQFNKINPYELENITFPNNKWIHKWGIDQLNANFIYEVIRQHKPKILIETGTFEAQGTYVIAKAMNENNNNAILYTIDYDGDPTSNFDDNVWKELKKIRDNNLNLIKQNFPNCKVIFLNGDSREMLSTIFSEYKETQIDFFYQDSMHFKDGIIQEYNLVKEYLYKDSITIFDDASLKGVKEFMSWFKEKESKNYYCYFLDTGHKQFIIQKK